MKKPVFRTYQLFIHVEQEVEIRVGKLGSFVFPAGIYTYTGSAKHNPEARIRRHYSSLKKVHWHIDYLLMTEHTRIVHVARYTAPECVMNKKMKGKVLHPKFGASDCKAGCGGHLKYLGNINPEYISKDILPGLINGLNDADL